MGDYSEIQERILSGEFRNKMEYPDFGLGKNNPEVRQKRVEYSQETERLNLVFKAALEEHYEVTGSPKKDELWRLAWELGHSSGLSEVLNYYHELVVLVEKDKTQEKGKTQEVDVDWLLELLVQVEVNLHTSASRSGLELRHRSNKKMEEMLLSALDMDEEEAEKLWLDSLE